VTPLGKRGSPEASTAASHGRPTCASMVRSVGSSCCSTSARGLTLIHLPAQRNRFLRTRGVIGVCRGYFWRGWRWYLGVQGVC